MRYFIRLVIILVCVKCCNIDVRIYSTLVLLSSFFSFFFLFFISLFLFLFSSWLFCHFDIDVCIYSTCPFFFFFWIVKGILMLIMYSAAIL